MNRILVILAISLCAKGALATPPTATPSGAGTADRDGNVTRFSFDDDLVQGDLVRPDGEVLRVRRRMARHSLIRIRDQFIDRLLRAAEDL